MNKTLVIVESFAKSKKIQQILGNDYIVLPSFGHITELDNEKFNRLGVDIQNNFKPIYTFIQDKRNLETVEKLKKVAKDCNKILICGDPDREGEIISYSISNMLLNSVSEKNRCTFNEITPSAIKEAIKNPRTIDMNMVYSGQARQVLDKVAGYDLSPVLWKYVGPKLSAGRVQSVALKMVVEKEKQVENFENSASFKTYGTFFLKENKNIHASLNSSFENQEKAKVFLQNILSNNYCFIVSSIDKIKVSKKPPAPFITSTIQQEAGCRFKISPKKVMSILQKLYENGYVTYIRTDSVTLSNDALQNTKEYILDNFGADYHTQRQYKNKEGSQQGHEAIRPSYIDKPSLPENEDFDKLERKIYELIWKRTIASQMTECVSEIHTLKIMIEKYDPYAFIAKSEKIIFDGYRKIYDENYDGKKESNDEHDIKNNEKNIFESMKVGSVLKMKSINSIERAAQPIPRYSEAFLIKNLEKCGVGRPSTYASTIETLLDRKYVEIRDIEGKVRDGLELSISDKNKNIEEKVIKIKVGEEKKKMVPTSIGRATCEFLEKHFANIMNYNFTSQMETKLDDIAQGKHVWYDVVREYYNSFHPTVSQLLDKSNSETAKKMKNDRKRSLGKDGNNRNVYVYVAKYGPVFQIGEDDEKDKKYVKMDSNTYSLDTVTIEDYLLLCKYPKLLGRYASETGEKDVFLKKGPYGFYVSYDGKNYNLPSGENSTIEEFVFMMNHKQSTPESTAETPIQSTLIKEFGKYMVKNGKYGPYVQYEKTIAKIPKDIVVGDITKDVCKDIIDKAKSVSKDVKKKKQYFASSSKKKSNDDQSI
jgi:DNA topoisomerase-1